MVVSGQEPSPEIEESIMYKSALMLTALFMLVALAGQGCPAPAGNGGGADTGGTTDGSGGAVDTGGSGGSVDTGGSGGDHSGGTGSPAGGDNGNTSPAPLVADAGPDATADVNSAFTLSGSASGGVPPYSYVWEQTAGVAQTLANANTAQASVASAQLGTATFRLKVSDSAGATASDEVTVTVAFPPNLRLVKQSAQGANNGLTWADAYTDLQDALQAARDSNGQITEIWVAQANYKPSPTDPGVSFKLVSGVGLYGGFNGGETKREQRDNVLNQAHLDGDLQSNDGPNLANRDDNSHTIVQIVDGNSATVLDGFTIQSGTSDYGAAGILISGGSPAIRHCQFQFNAGLGASSNGGAAYIYSKASPTFSDCTFLFNSSQYGGAVYCTGSSPEFSRTIFRSNTANRAAAMILLQSTVSLTDSTFDQNVSQTYGAVESSETGLTVLRCTFTKNRSNNSVSGAINASSNLRVLDSVFAENYAKYSGGAMDIRSENVTLAGCLFYGNTCDSGSGGAVYTQGKMMRFINCTVAYNNAFANGGAGIQFTEADTVISNCILWGNTLAHTDFTTVEGAQLGANSQGLAPVMNYSCVQGLSGKLGGTGNIGSDPLFLNAGSHDFHLQSNSPCVNAGDSSAVPFDLNKDLDGGPRFLGTPPVVDMGVYER
jgi:hypothetical protein